MNNNSEEMTGNLNGRSAAGASAWGGVRDGKPCGAEWRELRGGEAVEAVNVRRHVSEPDVWVMAGCPAVVRSDGMVPVASFGMPGTGKRAVLMLNGRLLGAVVTDAAGPARRDVPVDAIGGPVTELGQIDGEVLAAYVVEPDVVRVMLRHRRAVYLTYSSDGRLTLHGELPPLPALRFEVNQEVRLTQSVSGFRLKGGTPASATGLNAADTALLGKELHGAYRRLAAQAVDLGMFLQPALFRYRLEDANGDTIACGPAVMVGPAGGFQCIGEHTLVADGGMTAVSGGTMVADAFNVALMGMEVLPAPWNRIVSRVVVESSRLIDPVDDDVACSSVLSRQTDGTMVVKTRLGGVLGSSVGMSARLRSKSVEMLTRGEWIEQGGCAYPFAAGGSARIVVALSGRDVRKDRMPVSRLRDAESFGACCVAGDLLVAADSRHEAENGFSPMEMVVRTDPSVTESWRMVVETKVVTAGGGEALAVRTVSGSGPRIEGLSPLLVFPDRRAIAMKVCMILGSGADRRVYSQSYDLTEVKGCGCACFVDGNLKCHMPAAVGVMPAVPDSTMVDTVDEGVLHTGLVGRFGRERSESRVSDGAICALVELPNGSGSWDFSRYRFLAGGECGIRVVTLAGSAGVHGVRRLTGRPVGSGAAMCRASLPDGECVLAVAGGDLVKVGASRVETLACAVGDVLPGYCAATDEIWLTGSGGCRRIWREGKRIEMSVVEWPFVAGGVRPVMWSGRLFLAGSGGLYDAGVETGANCGRMHLRLRYDLGMSSVRLSGLRFNVFASAFSGRLALYADRGTRVAEPLLRLDVDGALNAPVTVATPRVLRRFCEVEVDGECATDAEWRSPAQKK